MCARLDTVKSAGGQERFTVHFSGVVQSDGYPTCHRVCF